MPSLVGRLRLKIEGLQWDNIGKVLTFRLLTWLYSKVALMAKVWSHLSITKKRWTSMNWNIHKGINMFGHSDMNGGSCATIEPDGFSIIATGTTSLDGREYLPDRSIYGAIEDEEDWATVG